MICIGSRRQAVDGGNPLKQGGAKPIQQRKKMEATAAALPEESLLERLIENESGTEMTFPRHSRETFHATVVDQSNHPEYKTLRVAKPAILRYIFDDESKKE
jgi:hypothetical protein